MTPEDVEKYAKLLRMVMDPAGNDNEQQAARKVMARMKEKFPGIDDAALHLLGVGRSPPPGPQPRPEAPRPPSFLGGLGLGGVLQAALGTIGGALAAPYRQVLLDATEKTGATWLPVTQIATELAGEDADVGDQAALIHQAYQLHNEGLLEVRTSWRGVLVRRKVAP